MIYTCNGLVFMSLCGNHFACGWPNSFSKFVCHVYGAYDSICTILITISRYPQSFDFFKRNSNEQYNQKLIFLRKSFCRHTAMRKCYSVTSVCVTNQQTQFLSPCFNDSSWRHRNWFRDYSRLVCGQFVKVKGVSLQSNTAFHPNGSPLPNMWKPRLLSHSNTLCYVES